MEHFFHFGFQEDILGFKTETSMGNRNGAFVKYVDQPRAIQKFPRRIVGTSPYNDRNLNKRMVEFLKNRIMYTSSITMNSVAEAMDSERERIWRHTINERIRREKQKQSYLALHSILRQGTKKDKNSIMKVAANQVNELQRLKEELERENYELESASTGRLRHSRPNDQLQVLEPYHNYDSEGNSERACNIRLRVAHPSSGIDSMLGVLKCLKQTSSKSIAMRSEFSQQEFSAVLEIQTEIEAAKVEEAMQRTLAEVEKNLPTHFSEG